jgi:adenylate cyclase
MTVLFSDVRGFTTISEGLDPKALSRLMNEFLTPMTRVIHKHRGTIDKYMGDAIMAFWGAPLNDPYHAKNALLAGMEMIKVLEEQQPRFQERGWPEIKIGVGLSTGTMTVGNMGSEFRMAYTVLGDTVNLGSRLEGLTKQYGVSMIVSEAVTEAVPEFEYLELDRVRVKGKDKPVTIYEPLGFSIELDKDTRSEAKRFNKALVLYREQNWDMAEREIFSLSQSNPKRAVYKIYLDRIMYFRNNPPGENWDGVFIHTSK